MNRSGITRLVIPALALAAFVWLAPLLYAFVLSFSNVNPGGPATFSGVLNYLRALTDPRFANAVLRSFLFAGPAAFICTALGLGIALAIRNSPKARATTHTVLLVPWALSELAVALIWRGYLDQQFGLVNMTLTRLGFAGVPWATSAFWATAALINAWVWRGLGVSTLLQSAGVTTLPNRLLWAARLDGAGTKQVLTQIVWPHQRRYLLVNFLMTFLGAMVAFSLPFALTGGGPLFSTETASLYAYRTAFSGSFDLGYAAAQGVIVLAAYAILASVLMKRRAA
jgi:multiple sugar transport system permease protein